MADPSHIGQRIRENRRIRHMSVQALANAVNISVSTLEKYERGNRNPPPGTIVRIAKALAIGPGQLTGQPYFNGAEADDQVQVVIPDLRRIMLTYDSPDALDAAPRPLAVLADEMLQVARMRQDGAYIPMGPLLPGLLAELTHVALNGRVEEQGRAFWWLARGYRAANSLAHKLGYHDLSLTAVERVQWAADRSGDGLMQATAAYLRASAMLRLGAFQSSRRVLEELLEEVYRMAPEGCLTEGHSELVGAIHLKLAVLEARDRRPEQSASHLADAKRQAAWSRGRELSQYEMAFGPANVRIHEIAALIDSGDTEQALGRVRDWGDEQGLPEWELPAGVVAERASHHHIDLGSARLAEGDRRGALRSMQAARRLAPAHTRFHPTVRSTASALLRQERNPSDELTGFAHWVGVANT